MPHPDPDPDPEPLDPLIGARIEGRYTVLGRLGRGGMGVVYDGVHDELGRAVAIKVLNAGWASDRDAVARFLREARTAGSLTHGNIVDVSDLGRLPDGRPFLVMPKVTGTDLGSLLRQSGPQPPKRVAELLSGVAAALDLIHAKGLVHRDIKPENLMYVVREDESETVMLLDFGIAALVASNEPRLTRRGAIFGTPEYLPPEVWDGKLPDRRGDIYALATVAFELMTGELPFIAENVMQILPLKVKTAAPSMVSVSAQAFPSEVEAVIARGLAREPRDRYDTASALVHALRQATAEAPVSWRPGALGTRLQTPMRPTAHDSGGELEEPSSPTPHSVELAVPVTREERSQQADVSTLDAPRSSLPPPLPPARPWLAYAAAGSAAILLLWWALSSDAPPEHTVRPAPALKAAQPVPAPAADPRAHAPEPTASAAKPAAPIAPTAEPAAVALPARKPSAARQPSSPPAVLLVKPAAAPPPTTDPQPAPSKPSAPSQPARDPVQAAQLTREGTSALLGGQVAHATELLQRATRADPSHAPAWRGLGLAFERTNRIREALDAYQKYLRLDPRGAQADKVRERVAALRK